MCGFFKLVMWYCVRTPKRIRAELVGDSSELERRSVDLRHPYLTRQLIAYLGNKRKLLPDLYSAFQLVESIGSVSSFLDPFAGSGAVSRLAKLAGYMVFANDWESFAFTVCAAHLTIAPDSEFFADYGGVPGVFAYLGTVPNGEPGTMCLRYSPSRTDSADFRRERLFYTRENAMYLDTMRGAIEDLYPGWDLDSPSHEEKLILLASLVYEAATHANTNGVFKAFHKEFGGFGGEALSRILAPMEMEPPLLAHGAPSVVGCEDASEFAARHPVDLCYLDPPYNQHQYGSNYHMLNTVVFGDDPPFDDRRNDRGELISRAGIREDWKRTKSPFCSRRTAAAAFARLFGSIDARFILLSYNTDGTCDAEEMFELLANQGSVRLINREYVAYPGGKQSIHRLTHGQELLFVLDRSGGFDTSSRGEMQRRICERQVGSLLKRPLHPLRVHEHFASEAGRAIFARVDGSVFDVPSATLALGRVQDADSVLSRLSSETLFDLRRRLLTCMFRDRVEEAEALLNLLNDSDSPEIRAKAISQLLHTTKKFAFRKYRERFEVIMDRIGTLLSGSQEFVRSETRFAEIRAIADRRFNSHIENTPR